MQKLEIISVHATVDEKLTKYVNKKIGQLDKYIAKNAREAAHAQVRLKEGKSKDKKQATCEVTLHLPKETINITETSINMYTAVDIVETKLKIAIKKYSDMHAPRGLRHRLGLRQRTPVA